MKQIRTFADERELQFCVYCGDADIETRDHVPSRVLLDEPYPDNLPVVPSCRNCNGAFSIDEEYVACLIECVATGTTESYGRMRAKVARILRDRPRLAARLSATKTSSGGRTAFAPGDARVRNVVIKLARGHAAFELHASVDEEPTVLSVEPLVGMTGEQRAAFEKLPSVSLWPEIGSRAMQRLFDVAAATAWIVVQPDRYRYFAAMTSRGPLVRFVLSEYLACEVGW